MQEARAVSKYDSFSKEPLYLCANFYHSDAGRRSAPSFIFNLQIPLYYI